MRAVGNGDREVPAVQHYIDQIDAALGEGHDLGWIEDEIIDQAPVSEEGQSALWLYAWVMLSRENQRTVVLSLGV